MTDVLLALVRQLVRQLDDFRQNKGTGRKTYSPICDHACRRCCDERGIERSQAVVPDIPEDWLCAYHLGKAIVASLPREPDGETDGHD